MRISRLAGYVGGLVAAALLVPAAALAATDAGARDAIERRLEKEKRLRGAVVSVAVENDAATLEGVVETLAASNKAEKLARKEVDTVHNRLVVRPAEPVKDKDVAEGIRHAVLTFSRYGIFDHVEFAVNEGSVLLQGSVVMPWKKTAIEDRVANVVGVRAIQNDIAVQSASPFDSDLRRTLARRIYGDSRFSQYSHWAQPPIRILVDRGNVVLAGIVSSPVEKVALEHIARGTLSFNVENRLQVESDIPPDDRKEEAGEGDIVI